jgi:hypothetical protein
MSQLSGGMRQRVAMARALALDPALFLLDEPLSALDAKLREGMQVELRRLQQRVGITTIIVTHDQEEAMAMADLVVVMGDNRVQQVGPPLEIYRRPATASSPASSGATTSCPRAWWRPDAVEVEGVRAAGGPRRHPARRRQRRSRWPRGPRACACTRGPAGAGAARHGDDGARPRPDGRDARARARPGAGRQRRNGFVEGDEVWVELPEAGLVALAA